MEDIYAVCMLLGAGLPLVKLILVDMAGLFAGACRRMDRILENAAGRFRLGGKGTEVCFLPVSLQGIGAGLLAFGVAGRLVSSGNPWWTGVLAGIPAGYLTAAAAETLVWRLWKTEHTLHPAEELLKQAGFAVSRIRPGRWGTVSITTPDGIMGFYSAKTEKDGQTISSGTKVKLLRFEGNYVVVSPEKKKGPV